MKDYLPFISSLVGIETSYTPTSYQIQTNVETVVTHRLPMAVAKKKLLNQFIISLKPVKLSAYYCRFNASNVDQPESTQ